MKAIVNEKDCVGCGLCADTCPAVFVMDGALAKVIVAVVPASEENSCKEAAKNCPVDAIVVS